MSHHPQNVGIKAIELYCPSQCVDQAELEKFDGVSEGKYTIGLGQTRMSFCDDREDINSIALTAVSSLLRKYNIDPTSIGRLEVGTETILDKSKSVKTHLMQLFEASGNDNIEGVDTLNACYGGTNALFNTLQWMTSPFWDGRNAIVVAGDIALYQKGNARPTGGAGCVAMLITPDAPLAFETGARGTFMKHAFDFYKPDLTSEYPVVDGQFSLQCYTEAIDKCYKDYNRRAALKRNAGGDVAMVNGNSNGVHNGVNGFHEEDNDTAKAVPLDRFDYMCFHAPTCKLVSKSYGRLLYNDYLLDPSNPAFSEVPAQLRELEYASSLTDKVLEKTFLGLTKKRFEKRVKPSMQVPTMCGNMYCGSVYGSVCSLLSNVSSEELQGKRVGIFSYGSGLASSLFSLKVRGSTQEMADKVELHQKLDSRRIVPPEMYDEMCELRHKAHLKKNFTPAGQVDTILPGTYYLTGVDDMFRRTYAIKS